MLLAKKRREFSTFYTFPGIVLYTQGRIYLRDLDTNKNQLLYMSVLYSEIGYIGRLGSCILPCSKNAALEIMGE